MVVCVGSWFVFSRNKTNHEVTRNITNKKECRSSAADSQVRKVDPVPALKFSATASHVMNYLRR